MKNKKFKLLGCLFLALVLCLAFTATALAADPAHHKNSVTENGVTTITLDVTGEAKVDVETAANVNVLVVFDTSNSMTSYRADGTTGNPNNDHPARADQAEKAVYDFAQALFKYQDSDDPTNIQMALMVFNYDATMVQSWTSTESDITGKLSSTGNYNSRVLDNVGGTNYYGSGTNWEAALQLALTTLGSASTDGDPTFVIFVTDGAPSKYMQDGAVYPDGTGWNAFLDAEDAYGPAQDEALNIENYDTAHHTYDKNNAAGYEDNTKLYGIYAYGTEADYLDDVIYYALNGQKRATERPQTDDTSQYFNAGSTSELTAAIEEIFTEIVNALGVAAVEMKDGTTSQVTTSSGPVHLLEVDESSYKYYLEIPLSTDDENNKYYTDNDNVKWIITVSGSTATFTNAEDSTKTATYEVESSSSSKVKVKWKEGDAGKTAFYVGAPAAQLNSSTGAVDWALTGSDFDPLLNGVTYYYSFDCVPSQETNDMIAKLKNGELELVKSEDDPDDESIPNVDEDIAQYLHKDESGNYSLDTNTEATLSYKDTRLPEGQQGPHEAGFTNPKSVPAEAEEIDLQKIWIGSYVNSQGLKEEEQDVTLLLVCDEEDTETTPEAEKNDSEVTLKYADDFEESTFISIGSMSVDKNTGVGKVYVTGHDFCLKETGAVSYHWELIADVMHPMAVNGNVTMLVEADPQPAAEDWPEGEGVVYAEIDEVEYYLIGGKYYTPAATDTNAITATNYRRADINLTKTVVGEDAPKGAEFEFEATLKVPANAPNGEQIWFSVAKPGENGWEILKDADVTGATAEKNSSNELTGYWYCDSETTVTIKIQAGWNVRFTNVLSGTEYDIVEKNLPKNFYCTDIAMAYEMIADDAEVPEGYEPEITLEDKDGNIKNEIKGSAVVPANSYTITYTDTYQLSTVIVEKTFDGIDEDDLPIDDYKATVAFSKALTYKGADADIPTSIDLTIDPEDEEGTDEGGTDEGGTDEGGTDEGGTDEGGTDEGGTDEEEATDEITVKCEQDGTKITWTISNVPVGLNVEVTESGYDDIDGYNFLPPLEDGATAEEGVKYSVITADTFGDDGEADTADEEEEDLDDTPTAADADTQLALTNYYEVATGTLKVQKVFADLPDDVTKPAVTIKAVGPETYTFSTTATGTGAPTVSDDGNTYTWTVTAPVGDYVVTETSIGTVTGYDVTTTYSPETPAAPAEQGDGNQAKDETTEEPATSATVPVAETGDPTPAVVTNTYTAQPGTLTITKTFAGDITDLEDDELDEVLAALEESFTITVAGQADEGAKTYTLKLGEVDPPAEGAEQTEFGPTTSNFPTYTWVIDVAADTYTVTETDGSADVENYEVTTTYTGSPQPETTESASQQLREGTEDEASEEPVDVIVAPGSEDAEATVTNTYESTIGTITVTKTFAGDITELSDEELEAVLAELNESFEITLTPAIEEGTTYTLVLTPVVVEEGQEQTEFGPDDTSEFPTYTWTIDIKAGIYTVEETEGSADVENYEVTTTYTGSPQPEVTEVANEDDPTADAGQQLREETGDEASEEPVDVIVEGGSEDAEATVTNTYEREKGYLQIVKYFEGLEEYDGTLPSVKFTVTDADGNSKTVTVEENDEGAFVSDPVEIATGECTVKENSAPSISGYTFVSTDPEGETTVNVTVDDTEREPYQVIFTNTYEEKETPPPPDKPYYWLYFVSNGGTEYDPEYYPEGQIANVTYEPIRPGYTFEGWYADPEFTTPVTQVLMDRNHTVYAKWSKTETPGWLNDDDHIAYLIGYPDGLIQPNWNITRAEVATIFFRLLKEEVREEYLTSSNSFSDVVEGQWFNTAISTVAKMGIVTGYPDGTFKPNANITRAEFATIAARFDQQTRGTGDHFTDLDGHWAKEYIERAAKKGWVTGYPDGTFRPENLATRAEVATLVNRVLNRDPESPEDLLEGMVEWPDNMDTGAWYYLALQEASNTHEYERETKPTEVWTVLLENPDWTIYNH